MSTALAPENWGLSIASDGRLVMGGISLCDLARIYGTPLHVANEERLRETARRFCRAIESGYPGQSSVHYAFKCNSVPAIVQNIMDAGLKAEVMSEFELRLALVMGYRGGDIVVNGPCKSDSFLRACLHAEVRLIVIDSVEELLTLSKIARQSRKRPDILLRINPDYTPRGVNSGAATASRRGCAFGLDLKGGEVIKALRFIKADKNVSFRGYHFHIGTGIRDPKDYSRALRCLRPIHETTREAGFGIEVLDVGGGFASTTTREMTTREMLVYQGLGRLPKSILTHNSPAFDDFAGQISQAITHLFPENGLPELILEPGRCIASPNQLLLLTVHRVKERPGVAKWLITDGGLGTVTLPTFYEHHEVLLCNDGHRPRTEKATIIGPACFAGDIVYRNKLMPQVNPGDVIAIMDSGAYFTALESSFGFPRPAIAGVCRGRHRLIRRRETFEEMISRDHFFKQSPIKEEAI